MENTKQESTSELFDNISEELKIQVCNLQVEEDKIAIEGFKINIEALNVLNTMLASYTYPPFLPIDDKEQYPISVYELKEQKIIKNKIFEIIKNL